MTGGELRSARVAAGLRVYDVPRRIPVSTIRWHRIEHGLAEPTEAELADFERFVKTPPRGASTPGWDSTATSPTSGASSAGSASSTGSTSSLPTRPRRLTSPSPAAPTS